MGKLNLEVSKENKEGHSYTRTEGGGFKEHSMGRERGSIMWPNTEVLRGKGEE